MATRKHIKRDKVYPNIAEARGTLVSPQSANITFSNCVYLNECNTIITELVTRHRYKEFVESDITRVAGKTATLHWRTGMMVLRLCWPIFALSYMYHWTTSHIVPAQTNGRIFGLVDGVRDESQAVATQSAASLAECALMCIQDKLCWNFNFGSGQCELLAATSCRTSAPGWTHGYNQAGIYWTYGRGNFVSIKNGIPEMHTYLIRMCVISVCYITVKSGFNVLDILPTLRHYTFEIMRTQNWVCNRSILQTFFSTHIES